MNANDNSKNDFIFFKNEVLSDMKNLESRISDKIFQINEIISQQNTQIDNKLKDLNNKYDTLYIQLQEKKDKENFENILKPIKHKLEESISKVDIKLNLLEKDYGNSCYKYDKMFSNNLNVPGLIGSSCPYDSLRPFLEYVNLKITELIKAKEKQNFDTKKYKEKLETIINNNKKQFDTEKNKINDYCKKGFEQCDINCTDRINIIEKRIEALRIENGEFAYNLQKRSEELRIEWEKLDNFEKNMNVKFNEEMVKYKILVDNISKKFDKSKDQFNLIKMRFTELSDFIKDIRFRRNIHNTFQERKQYKDMSIKIDFTKKQKLQNGEGKEMKEDEENKDKDILAPFDYYSHFGLDKSFKEEDEFLDENNNETINRNINKENINKNENIHNERYENNFISIQQSNYNGNNNGDIKPNINSLGLYLKEQNSNNKKDSNFLLNSQEVIRKENKFKTQNYLNNPNQAKSFVILNDINETIIDNAANNIKKKKI